MPDVETDTVSYEDIITKTYIDPIRSVIAVDDEFPTLEAVLSLPPNGEDDEKLYCWKGAELQAERLKNFLEKCRKKKWIFDVHDGKDIKPDSDGSLDIQHLHQTDLMVLDYEPAFYIILFKKGQRRARNRPLFMSG